MGLQERLEEDLKRAVRERSQVRRLVLRSIRSEAHNAEIKLQKPLDEYGILGIVSTQVRQHRESISEFRKGNRDDLVQREEEELQILLEYLPPQLTPDEIATLVQGIIQEVGARGPGDKGKVMGRLMPQVKGKADGSTVNTVVTQLLEAL